MPGTTKLKVYNGALVAVGEALLSSTGDNVESRRIIDNKYDECVEYCLEKSYWGWATRAVTMTYDDTVTPNFGFTYAFAAPSDLLRVSGVWSDAVMNDPITDYQYERGYFYANVTPLYVTYVSNNASYGLDLTKWPSTFAKYVEGHLAAEICERFTQNASRLEQLRKREQKLLREAVNMNVMDKPARFPPVGQWRQSRYSGFLSSSLRGTGRGL